MNIFYLLTLSPLLSLQARCQREKPPCKYYHPPQHLKDQLLINGRNHLALKNALMQQMGMPQNGQQIITNQMQPMVIKSVWMCLWRFINKIIVLFSRSLSLSLFCRLQMHI
jgi:hypothetical protein